LELLLFFWDLVVHLDKHLADLLTQYGTWVYAIMFLIIFCETGLVVMPFLPGDSLLFIAGALWAATGMDIHVLMALLIMAAILGDTVNYSVGAWFGPRVFQWEESRWFNRRALQRTHEFYERHGGKTIVIARFLPFIRTFAPFVAGVGSMSYPRFLAYNVCGAVLWVVSLLYAGYFFGDIPWVKNNLTAIIFALIIIPGLPALFAVVQDWREQRRARLAGKS
jgi:membrane-associated protein